MSFFFSFSRRYSKNLITWVTIWYFRKVTNHTGLCDTELAWYSPSVTLCSREQPRNLTWSCQIVEVFATRTKFLEPSGYCIVINCAFTFSRTKCLWLLPQRYSQFWTRDAHHVSAPSITILPITEGILHSLNCFGHMIYTSKTNTYH